MILHIEVHLHLNEVQSCVVLSVTGSCLWLSLCSLCLYGTWFPHPSNIILGSDIMKGEPVIPAGTVSVRVLHPQLQDYTYVPGSSKFQFPTLKTRTPHPCLKRVWWDISITSRSGSIWEMCRGSPSAPNSALAIGPGFGAPSSRLSSFHSISHLHVPLVAWLTFCTTAEWILVCQVCQ